MVPPVPRYGAGIQKPRARRPPHTRTPSDCPELVEGSCAGRACPCVGRGTQRGGSGRGNPHHATGGRTSIPLPPPPRPKAVLPATLVPCTAATTPQPRCDPFPLPPRGGGWGGGSGRRACPEPVEGPGFASPRVISVLYLQRANSASTRKARRIPAATPDAETLRPHTPPTPHTGACRYPETPHPTTPAIAPCHRSLAPTLSPSLPSPHGRRTHIPQPAPLVEGGFTRGPHPQAFQRVAGGIVPTG